jgi:hypothetical protein
MGNKRVILKTDGTYRKVCQKTDKHVPEINFCECGRKRCWEGFRLKSTKALCKVSGFKPKFKPVYDVDTSYDEVEE